MSTAAATPSRIDPTPCAGSAPDAGELLHVVADPVRRRILTLLAALAGT